MDYSLPGSSVHGIPQARILEWVAMPSSRGSSRPRDQTHVYFVSCINRWILYHWSHQESQNNSWMITQLIGGRTRIQTLALYIASVTPTYDFCSRQPAWFVSTTHVGLESESEVAQSCPTLCDPMDCSLPGSSVHGIFQARVLLCPWDFPGKSTGVDCHFLLQGIFPTQGFNPGLPHCRQKLYRLSHQESLMLVLLLLSHFSRVRLCATP